MADLEVYYKTSERIVHGEELYRSVEEDPYEHYVYKYSPPAALYYIPFLLFSLSTAKYIYWAFLTFILGHTLFLLKKAFLNEVTMSTRIQTVILFAIVIVGTHFFRELHLGQVNLLLLWLFVLALDSFIKKKAATFGLFIAISIFIKPFALVFIPFILLARRFKEVAFTLGFMLILLLIPYLFYPEISMFTGLYASWIAELGIELGNKQDLLAAGNHTIFSVLLRSTPMSCIDFGHTGRIIYQLLVLGSIAVLLLYYMLRRKAGDSHIRIFIILTALIPLLAYTSYNAFIFTLPLIVYLMFHFREMNIIFKIIFIFSCLMIGGNIYDLVGREMFDLFWGISVYSWGTIGLLIVIFTNWNSVTD